MIISTWMSIHSQSGVFRSFPEIEVPDTWIVRYEIVMGKRWKSTRAHLILRSCEVSKLRDLYLELSDRSEIWQLSQQHCCWSVCQMSKRKFKLPISRLRDFTRGYDKTSYRISKWGLAYKYIVYPNTILSIRRDMSWRQHDSSSRQNTMPSG